MGGLTRYFGGGLDFLWGDDEDPSEVAKKQIAASQQQDDLPDFSDVSSGDSKQVESNGPSFSSVFGNGLGNFLSSAKNAYFPDRDAGVAEQQRADLSHLGNLDDPNLFAKQRRAILDVTGGNVKKVADISAGMLTDQIPGLGVNAAEGNESGQLLNHLNQKFLMGDPNLTTPSVLENLSEESNPLVSYPSRFANTLLKDTSGMAFDPNSVLPSKMVQGLQSGEMLSGLYDQVVNHGVKSPEDLAHVLPMALGAYHFGKGALSGGVEPTRATETHEGNIPNLEPIQQHAGFDFGELANDPLKNLESPNEPRLIDPFADSGEAQKAREFFADSNAKDKQAIEGLTKLGATRKALDQLAETHGTTNPERLASGYNNDVFSTDNPDLVLRANKDFASEPKVQWPDSKFVIKPKESVYAGGKQIDVLPALKKIVRPSPEQMSALKVELAKEGKYTLYDESPGNVTVIGGKARVVDPGALIPNEVVKNYEAAQGVSGPEAEAARKQMYDHIRRAGYDFDEKTGDVVKLGVGNTKKEEDSSPGYKSNFADVEKDLVDSGLMSPAELQQKVDRGLDFEKDPLAQERLKMRERILRGENESPDVPIKDNSLPTYKTTIDKETQQDFARTGLGEPRGNRYGIEDKNGDVIAYIESPTDAKAKELLNKLKQQDKIDKDSGVYLHEEGGYLPKGINSTKDIIDIESTRRQNELPNLDDIYSHLEQKAQTAREELAAKRSGKEVGQQLSAKDKRSLQLTEEAPVKVDELFDPETGELFDQDQGKIGPYEHLSSEQQIDLVHKGEKPSFYLDSHADNINKLEQYARDKNLPYHVEDLPKGSYDMMEIELPDTTPEMIQHNIEHMKSMGAVDVHQEGNSIIGKYPKGEYGSKQIFIGKDKESLGNVRNAKTSAELGKALGYSDADIKAFENRNQLPDIQEPSETQLPNIQEPKTRDQLIQESLNSIRAESGKSAKVLKPSQVLDTDLAGGGGGNKKPPKVTQSSNQPPGGKDNPANPQSERSTFDMITDVPKELKSSLDISFPFRQGLFLLNRPAALKGMGRGLKNFFSEKGHLDTRDYLENKWANRELAKNSGLAQVEYDPTAKTNTSEEFGWQGLGRVPGIKHSERSFIDSGNLVRANMFDEFVKNNPDKSPEFYKGVSDYLNTLTGRTPLPKSIAKLSNIANKAMWSPRFVASRVQLLNPAFYAKLPVEIQKAALRDVVGTLAGAAIVSGGVKALGDSQGEDTEIGVDPRQGNFGYVRVGKTSYNLFAGLSPLVKLYSRLITGQTKDKTGKVTALSGFSPGSALGLNEDKDKAPFGQSTLGEIGRFARGKESPALGTLHNLLEGKDFLGQQYNMTDVPSSLGLPLSIEDFITAFNQGGLEEALKTLPGIAGVGVQVQKPLAKDKKKAKKKKSSGGNAYPSLF